MTVWTEEMDDQLREFRMARLTASQVAEKMGLSTSAVTHRANKLGIRLVGRNWRFNPTGHRPADERSAELLRQAGVLI